MIPSRCVRVGWVAILGVALLPGCRTGRPAADDGVGPAPLSGHQTADVQVAMARTLEGRGEGQEATRYYAEAARNDPKRADAWGRLAILYDKEGKFAESEEAYRRATELQPNNADTLTNFGYSLYLQQRWPEAEAALGRAIAIKPDHQRAHNNLGLVMARTGRTQEALAAFQRAGCSTPDAHTNVAYASTLSGDFAAASSYYKRVLELDPASETARKGLEGIDALAAKLGPAGREPRAGGEIVPVAATVPAASPATVRPSGP
jgi:Tfp pilus assembly protein PilF